MSIQDDIFKALKRVPKPSVAAINEARWAEEEKEQIDAATVGVDPEEYRKWASGRPMPEVTKAVQAFMDKREWPAAAAQPAEADPAVLVEPALTP